MDSLKTRTVVTANVERKCKAMFSKIKECILLGKGKVSITKSEYLSFVNYVIDFIIVNPLYPENQMNHEETDPSINPVTNETDSLPNDSALLLHQIVEKWIKYCILSFSVPVLKKIHQDNDEERLISFLGEYKRFSLVNSFTSKLFAALDKENRINDNPESLCNKGNKCFLSLLVQRDSSVLRSVCNIINLYRDEKDCSFSRAKEVINLLLSLDKKVYPPNNEKVIEKNVILSKFESVFLEETLYFFKKKSITMLEEYSSDITMYFDKCGFYLKREEETNKESLPISFLEKTQKIYIHELISSHLDLILEQFSNELIQFSVDRKNQSIRGRLKNYYDISRLSSRFDPESMILEKLAITFGDMIKNEINAKIISFKTTQEIILSLIDSFFFYRDQLSTIFVDENSPDKLEIKGSSQLFCTQFIKAFEAILSQKIDVKDDQLPSAEVLSNFCDMIQTGSKDVDLGLYSLTTETTYEGIVALLMRINDKDFFAEEYSKNLSRRLLDRDPDDEKERDLITMIKSSLGAGFTHKFEIMLKDRNTSQEICSAFSNYCSVEGNQIKINDFKVLVLTSGCWPRLNTEVLPLPECVEDSISLFKKFYSSKFNNRVLSWCHETSKVVLNAMFKKGKRELMMSAYQALVCLLFEEKDLLLSVKEIQELTKIRPPEAKNAIAGLCLGRSKIFNIIRGGNIIEDAKKIEESDQISFNADFVSKTLKVSIPTPKKAVARTKTGITASCEENRKFVYDATIVRIMKSRRKLNFNEIITETLSQVTLFRGDIKSIRARIEDLIQREFIRRDEQDGTVFHYVA